VSKGVRGARIKARFPGDAAAQGATWAEIEKKERHWDKICDQFPTEFSRDDTPADREKVQFGDAKSNFFFGTVFVARKRLHRQ
jgi:hypothetical protein